MSAGAHRRPAFRLVAARTLPLALALLALTAALRGAEPDAPPQIRGVHAGFAGLYKVGQWTPVEIDLQGTLPAAAECELTVPDVDGVPSRVTVACPPPTDEARRAALAYVKFGQARGDLKVRLLAGGRPLAEGAFLQGGPELAPALPAGHELLVAVGPASFLPDAVNSGDDGPRSVRVAHLDDATRLPTRWFGYEGVDQLIFTTSQPERCRGLDGDRLAALDQWVRLGGRLVLSVGRNGALLLADDAPLARFVPGKFDRVVPVRQTGAIETYAETTERLAQPGADGQLVATRLDGVRGRIEAFDGNQPRDLPLVIRAAYGLGEVTFVALDLDRPPLDAWNARRKLFDKLLARPQAATLAETDEMLGQVTKLGYSDLAGQLQSGLDQFAGVELVPFSVVAGLVLLYILLIGPGDYFLLRRLLRRMELTWITFPLLVLVFSAGAYFLAYRLKGTELRVNQVDLVDLDTESRQVRGTSWTTVYSPQIETFDLGLAPGPAVMAVNDPGVLLSWMGLPGASVAGGGAAGGTSLFSTPYDYSPQLNALRGLPISIWSTRSLVGRWWGQAQAPLAATLVDRGDRLLSGTLEIGPDLLLSDAVLVYDRWAYPVHQWQAGSTIRVEQQLEPQTVETWLRHIAVLDEKEGRAPYDRGSNRLDRIMEMTMFHDLAGGQRYTGLAHRFQGFADLSNHVRLHRAILVGRGGAPAATLERDGRPLASAEGQHLTFYRFVLPVRQAELQ